MTEWMTFNNAQPLHNFSIAVVDPSYNLIHVMNIIYANWRTAIQGEWEVKLLAVAKPHVTSIHSILIWRTSWLCSCCITITVIVFIVINSLQLGWNWRHHPTRHRSKFRPSNKTRPKDTSATSHSTFDGKVQGIFQIVLRFLVIYTVCERGDNTLFIRFNSKNLNNPLHNIFCRFINSPCTECDKNLLSRGRIIRYTHFIKNRNHRPCVVLVMMINCRLVLSVRIKALYGKVLIFIGGRSI